MTTTVSYHAEQGSPARPAINVKANAPGLDYWPDGRTFPQAGTAGENDRDYDAIVGAACERIASDFWQAAEQIATERGLGEITQEGRSGGWLVFTSGYDPQTDNGNVHDFDMTERRDWLAGYAAMTEWAEAWIADAPRKVRELAQSMAMDEAGERAALRMFATFRAVTA